MDIALDIVTGRRIALKFDEFPHQAHDGLLQVITRCTEQLRDLVEAAAPKQTGRLASEISSRIVDAPNHITGYVGVSGETSNDYAKAGALEYGAHGIAHLRAHAAKLDHLFAVMIQPMQVIIAAHDRHVNIAEHDYLRGPLHAMQDDVLAQLREALNIAVAE